MISARKITGPHDTPSPNTKELFSSSFAFLWPRCPKNWKDGSSLCIGSHSSPSSFPTAVRELSVKALQPTAFSQAHIIVKRRVIVTNVSCATHAGINVHGCHFFRKKGDNSYDPGVEICNTDYVVFDLTLVGYSFSFSKNRPNMKRDSVWKY